jgi:hypothetical protein
MSDALPSAEKDAGPLFDPEDDLPLDPEMELEQRYVERNAAYRPIAHHWCGQTQPHAAHEWQTPPAYGAATFIQTYQCGGYVLPPGSGRKS